MKIPKTIKIGAVNYKVIEVDNIIDTAGDCMGRCDIKKATIELKKEQSQEMKESTLLHEIIEAINAMCELEFSHKTICTLETMLHQVLKDNKLI
jgi:hypothetical protein